MARVLLVGYIAELLQEPERLFRAAGYDVTVTTSLIDTLNAIEQNPFDAAVLGFSIPETERNQLATALKDASQSCQIIMMYFASLKNTELADALMPTGASNEEVLRAVNHILSKTQSRLA